MKKIVYMEFGSRVYKTDVPESDSDFKGVAIPSSRDIVLQRAFKSINTSTGNDFSRNGKDDVDTEIFSLHQYLKLFEEGQTGALDMLFTPDKHILHQTRVWKELKRNKHKLLSKKMTAFAGYCKGQAAKYSLKGEYMQAYSAAMEFFQQAHEQGIDRVGECDLIMLKELIGESFQLVVLPGPNGKFLSHVQIGPKTKVPFTAAVGTAYKVFKEQYDKYGARAKSAMENQGTDWKALYHAVRICDEGIELCTTGQITFPNRNRELLLKIRKGELPYVQVAELIDEGLVLLDEAKAKSTLPDNPDRLWIENFIYDEYLTAITQGDL